MAAPHRCNPRTRFESSLRKAIIVAMAPAIAVLAPVAAQRAQAADATWSRVCVSGYEPVIPRPWIVVDSTRSLLYAFRDSACADLCGPDSLYTFSFAQFRWLPAREGVGWQWWNGMYSTGPSLLPVLDTTHDRLFNLEAQSPCCGGQATAALVLSLTSPGAWTRVAFSGTAPLTRSDAGIAYDPSRQLFWVSGGSHYFNRVSSPNLYDTWSLDANSWTWTLRSSGAGCNTPDVLGGVWWDAVSRMFIDTRGDRLLAVGGRTPWLAPCPGESTTKAIWQMPLAGPYVWSRITPYSAFPVGPFVFDSNRGRVLHIDIASGAVSENRLNGDPAWPLLQVSGTPPSSRTRAAVVFDAANDRVILYGGNTPDLTRTLTDLWVLTLDHTVPASASVVGASAVSGGIAVDWEVCGSSVGPAVIERRRDEESWTPLTASDPDNAGRVRLLDPDVGSGHRYGYRLSLSDGTSPTIAGEVWVSLPPFTASVVGTSVSAGGVAVEWTVGGASFGPAVVERRRDEEPWVQLTGSDPDSAGRVHLLDRDVASGHRYGYRLALGEGANQSIAGEVWVPIPGRELALAVGPNPATGFIDVRFSLLATGEARLELFDVSGRRVESRTVTGAAITGEGLARFGVSPRLSPGLYRVRLTQGGLRRHSSVVLVR